MRIHSISIEMELQQDDLEEAGSVSCGAVQDMILVRLSCHASTSGVGECIVKELKHDLEHMQQQLWSVV